MGTKYLLTNLYGYEIFSKFFVWVRNNFYKLVKNCWIALNFWNILILEKIVKEKLTQSHFLIHFYIYVFKEYIWYIKLFDQLRTCWSCALSNLKRLEVHLLLSTFYSDDMAPKNAD